MSLITLNVNMDRIADALERIATALEAQGPRIEDIPPQAYRPARIFQINDAEEAKAEREAAERRGDPTSHWNYGPRR